MKKVTLSLLPSLIICVFFTLITVAFESCKKNPCVYGNCDPKPEPKKEQCFVSKKLVREYQFANQGKSWTVYDADTSYYVLCDVKIIGHDSLAANAGVINLKPYEYCAAVYNYATIKSGKDTVIQDGERVYYCIRVALEYNPAGDPVGDSVLLSFDQATYNSYKGNKFMYN